MLTLPAEPLFLVAFVPCMKTNGLPADRTIRLSLSVLLKRGLSSLVHVGDAIGTCTHYSVTAVLRLTEPSHNLEEMQGIKKSLGKGTCRNASGGYRPFDSCRVCHTVCPGGLLFPSRFPFREDPHSRLGIRGHCIHTMYTVVHCIPTL